MANWLKKLKMVYAVLAGFILVAGSVGAAVLWVNESVEASASRVETSVKYYVDYKHTAVEQKLDSIEKVINRVDDRLYNLVKDRGN